MNPPPDASASGAPTASSAPDWTEDPESAAAALRVALVLDAAPAVWIAAHERPDGDALGSALGLSRLLTARGRDARLIGLEPIPPALAFLPAESDRRVRPGEQPPEGAVLAMLDCCEAARLSSMGRDWVARLPVATIEHHAVVAGAPLGETHWIDTRASSTGELVSRMALTAGWAMPPPAAAALWVAIASDTGRFCFSNTTPRTMRVAAELLARGADPAELSEHAWFSPSRAEVLLKARAMLSLSLRYGGRLACVRLSRADFDAVGAGPECAQEVANAVRGVDGARALFFFYELAPGRVKLSVRTSAPLEAGRFCQTFGGGGHDLAAGCAFEGSSLDGAEARALEAAGRLFFPGAEP